MNAQHVIFVCTGCGSSHKTNQSVVKSGGERRLEQLKTLHHDWMEQDDFAGQIPNAGSALHQNERC